jgi:hypothetical protein
MDESPPPNQHTPFLHGTLLPGQITNLPIALEGGGALFVAQWQTGTVRVTLIDPVGQIIDPAYADAHPEIVAYHENAGYATYSFPNAATGLWQVRLQAVDVPSSGTAYTTFAAFEGALTLTGGTNRAWYSPGAAMVITATLSPPPQNANVTATILLVDATSTTVSLAPLGGGRYRSNYLVPTRAGYAEVRLRATGTNTNGKPFERGTSLAFQIAPDTVTLNGSYGDTPEPRWSGATIYDALAVNVGIDVSAAGAYGISADLVDVNGHQVAHASTITDLPSGVESLTLRFRGSDIHASQRNGPYRLTNLLLSDHGGAALVVQEAINVYTTAGYRFRDFRQGDLFLPLVNRSNWLH